VDEVEVDTEVATRAIGADSRPTVAHGDEEATEDAVPLSEELSSPSCCGPEDPSPFKSRYTWAKKSYRLQSYRLL
jgi:hypothetical protein